MRGASWLAALAAAACIGILPAAPAAGEVERPVASATSGTQPPRFDGLPLRRDPEQETGTAYARVRVVLVVTLAALAAAVVVARRRGWGRRSEAPGAETTWLPAWLGRRSGAPVTVVQSVRLGPGSTMHVVAWNGVEYLVGSGSSGVTLIGQHAAESPARSSEPAPEAA